MTEPVLNTSPKTWDEIKTTTCYMCACRCGIKVYLKDGTVRYIEGNRDHPVNKGVICGKGAAGIMQHYSPARLSQAADAGGRARLGRIPRDRLGGGAAHRHRVARARCATAIRRSSPSSPAATRARRSPAGGPRSSARPTTPRMAASARSTWRRPGSTPSAARSGSSASPTGSTRSTSCCSASPRITPRTRSRSALGKLKARGAKVVSINPIRTGYSAIADEWIGIRPGTDGLFVGALIHELLRSAEDRSRLSACATPMRPGW